MMRLTGILFSLITGATVLAIPGMGRCGEYRVPLMAEAPTVDGRIDADEWSTALRVDGFAHEGALERRRATGYVGATDTHLLFAIRSQLPVEGELLAEVRRDTENLVFDDSVEVWIDPTPDAESGRRFQMLANSLGHRWYRQHPHGGAREDPTWSGNWDIAHGFHEGEWHCEVRVPIESVAPGRRPHEGVWGINLCRNWKQPWAWSSLGGGAYQPTEHFHFHREPGPVPSLELHGDPFDGDIHVVLALTNPGEFSGELQMELLLQRDLMPEIRERKTVYAEPHTLHSTAIEVADRVSNQHELTARLTSPDGAVIWLSRHLAWRKGEPFTWTTQKRIIPPVDFRFAYYPYRNRMRILADTSNLPEDAVLEQLTATVRERDGDVVKKVRFDELREGRQEQTFDLPPLAGKYVIAMRAMGQNVPDQEVVKPFERTVFEWEHNDLGKSTKVYPPFTPIRVDGPQLATVLREHTMNSVGLWDQVVARDEAILAGPMRWEIEHKGVLAEIAADTLQFTEIADHRATAQSAFSTDDLGARVTCTWDYDGTMRLDLTLLPSEAGGTADLDALTLVIPLRAEHATHYHAMGDGIRNTLYDRLPPGEGVIWTSEQVRANDLPANFCSYLYVGTPVRGLCWFAENDRNWSRAADTPNMALVHRNDEVEIRVHLVNRPLEITTPRTITFGLLAAPVKPRIPDDWRHKYRRDRYSLLGTDINWLALGDCGSVYPAGKEMYLWEMIARGNRERLSEAEVASVIERGKPYFEAYGPEKMESFVRHAHHNLRNRYGTRMIFYYNRASYQAAEEFETFKDEWALTDFRAIGKGDGIGEIKIVPSESYIDHALYWYGKSFDIGGNQGVYWDNWFFVGSYNTQMTGAYRREDGTVIPSTGIWGLRELSKRTFQFMNERGMLPITMPHMTSTQILPLHSFATVQYDWEWKYSEGDVQYRFPREYILMVSNGELAGTWPVLLGDHGDLADDLWTARTFAAVAMLHELDCSYSSWHEAGRQQLALFEPVDEILAQPGVQAYRYWDERPQPVVTDHADLPTIVYAVPGKEAVFAVVSYAEGDEMAHVAIDAQRLGLTAGYRVRDAETDDPVEVNEDRFSFKLKKHDVRVFRMEGETQ